MRHIWLVLAAFCTLPSSTALRGDTISVYQGGAFKGTIEAYTGLQTGAANYGYGSASAHPIHGPSLEYQIGKIWFYDSVADGLNFNVVFSVEDNSVRRVPNTRIHWNISVTDTLNPSVRLSDDPNEMFEVASGSGVDLFRGRWNYNNRNTDGGVIGEIGGSPDWTVTIDPLLYNGALTGLRAYDKSGSYVNLDLNTTEQIVFTSAAAVPTPSALVALLGMGVLGAVQVIRRRRR